MFRLAISEELLQRARERSLEWHAQRGNEYHKAMFPVDSEQEMTFDAIDLEELKSDKRNGIYFIFDNTQNIGYVGMASSMTFGERFYNGKEDCKEKCPPKCGCFGHINATPDTCRSSRIITPGAEYRVHILAEMDATTAEVMQSEVDWYYLLLEAGIEMTNADWALGRAGYTGRPIVSCNLETATYYHFLTIQEGHRFIHPDRANDAISPVLRGFQNQLGGYTHRYATIEEIESFQADRNITELIGQYPRVLEWQNNQGESMDEGSVNRNSLLRWSAGALRESDIHHLRRHIRGPYDKSNKSEYEWVYWDSYYERWYWKAYTRDFRSDGVKRREKMVRKNRHGNDFSSDREAAIEREVWIIKNKLTEINTSNFDWKPPKE